MIFEHKNILTIYSVGQIFDSSNPQDIELTQGLWAVLILSAATVKKLIFKRSM